MAVQKTLAHGNSKNEIRQYTEEDCKEDRHECGKM